MTRLTTFLRRLVDRAPITATGPLSDYQASLVALLTKKRHISVAVIGANDGKINDPFFPIAAQFPQRTRVLLVEPQPGLQSVLAENYAFHPDHRIVNGAIGSEGALTLHAVKPEYWSAFRPAYAVNWPDYRAPTGITSSDRQQVADWVVEFGGGLSPDTVIDSYSVACWTLPALLRSVGADPTLDVIQIDAEGTDDLVLYDCDIDQTKPSIVFLETKTIPEERKRRLDAFLDARGFTQSYFNGDTLAVRNLT
jgi:FkbM family methyltransferase